MKRLHIILLLGMLSLVSGLQAQEDAGEQLLVFRNTGVVDLLYTNEVDSILTNDTTQVFYAKDTVLMVPLAELDSVAVGSRNIVEYKPLTKVITDDGEWIIRYDGENVYYKPNTPSNILPKVGDRLFYGKKDEIFPIGLVCKVNAVDYVNNEYKVNVSDIELNEVFAQLFYAGPAKEIPAASRRAPIYNDKLTCNIPLEGIGPSLFPWTLHLFPPYTHTNAVVCQKTNAANETSMTKTEVATAVEELTQTDIETGFEIVDPQGDVVDSVYVGTIQAEPEDTTVAQTFDSEIIMPSTIKHADLEGYTMRPVFHYAGYTISAAPVGIKKDVLLQPYTATQSNGAMTFISSGPFQGSAVSNGTFYQVGAYLPVPLKNNVYKK